jgi:hypothetical protein
MYAQKLLAVAGGVAFVALIIQVLIPAATTCCCSNNSHTGDSPFFFSGLMLEVNIPFLLMKETNRYKSTRVLILLRR